MKLIKAIGPLDNPKQPVVKNWINPFLCTLYNASIIYYVICSVLHVVHDDIDMVSAFDKRKLV